MTKTCGACKLEKDASHFYPRKRSRDGLQHKCIRCEAKRVETWKRDPKNADKMRNTKFKALYGITLEKYKEMFEAQNGCCAACGRHQDILPNALCVDHDHSGSEIRELLCTQCNLAVGNMNDDYETALKVADYILRWSL